MARLQDALRGSDDGAVTKQLQLLSSDPNMAALAIKTDGFIELILSGLQPLVHSATRRNACLRALGSTLAAMLTPVDASSADVLLKDDQSAKRFGMLSADAELLTRLYEHVRQADETEPNLRKNAWRALMFLASAITHGTRHLAVALTTSEWIEAMVGCVDSAEAEAQYASGVLWHVSKAQHGRRHAIVEAAGQLPAQLAASCASTPQRATSKYCVRALTHLLGGMSKEAVSALPLEQSAAQLRQSHPKLAGEVDALLAAARSVCDGST
uniref:Uncharacterized protein n=1 Tax=Coccolithus braarudii TaxID=221442 RepID=A0A7S0LV70_9EUKA